LSWRKRDRFQGNPLRSHGTRGIPANDRFCSPIFRHPAFIVNMRSLDNTIASATRTGMGMASEQFTDADVTLREFVSEGASDVFHVHYDDYARNASALRGLFDFLGAPFNDASIRYVLNKKHSTFAEPVSG
jgi:hypothetical protein